MDATIQQLGQSIIAKKVAYQHACQAVSQLFAAGQAITPQLEVLRVQACTERDNISNELLDLDMQRRRVCIERMYQHYTEGKTLEEANELLNALFVGGHAPTEKMHKEFLFAWIRTSRQLRAEHGDHEDASIQAVLTEIEGYVYAMIEYGISSDGMYHVWEADMEPVCEKLEAKRVMLNLMMGETPEQRAARLAHAMAEEAEEAEVAAGAEAW
jgi:hypothetical protein